MLGHRVKKLIVFDLAYLLRPTAVARLETIHRARNPAREISNNTWGLGFTEYNTRGILVHSSLVSVVLHD